MITEGAERWRDEDRGLALVEKLLTAAMDKSARAEDFARVEVLADRAAKQVRAEQARLHSHLRDRFGIEVDDSLEDGLQIRVVDEVRARPTTLLEVARLYDVLIGLMTCNAAEWAMADAGRRVTAACLAKIVHARWWAERYRVYRVIMPTPPISYPAIAKLAAYVNVRRNASVMYAPLTQRGEGPPSERRLEEAALGSLAARVRSPLKMYERLRDALGKEGDPQEVLLHELPGAVMAEVSRLNAADADEYAAFLEDLGKVKNEARRGVHKVLVNRVSHMLSAGLADEKRTDTDLEQCSDEEHELATFFDNEELRSLIKKAGLSAQELEVFRLSAELKNKEIAEKLGRSQNQVAQEKFRAMQKLRRVASL